jgi:hypothetical protein
MSDANDAEEKEKNTQKQYAALGRFVQSFETMVHAARIGAYYLLFDGFVWDERLGSQQASLVGISLFHQSLTAKPIFEIFRAMLMEKISEKPYKDVYHIRDEEITIYSGVLGAISGEYELLANKRNDLLHGTWFVGFTDSDNPHAAKFQVIRHRTTAEGLKKLKMPETAPELDALSKRCDETTTWITTVQSCVPPSAAGLMVEDCFTRDGKIWERTWPSVHRFPSKRG